MHETPFHPPHDGSHAAMRAKMPKSMSRGAVTRQIGFADAFVHHVLLRTANISIQARDSFEGLPWFSQIDQVTTYPTKSYPKILRERWLHNHFTSCITRRGRWKADAPVTAQKK